MAKKTIEVVTCDLCGGEGYNTLLIEDREVDVCQEHDLAYTAFIEPYLKASTRASIKSRSMRLTGPSRTTSADAQLKKDARAWGLKQKKKYPELSERGPLPKNVLEDYQLSIAKS